MTTTLVRFRTGDGEYAVDVAHVLEVRNATAMMPLPSPLPGVAGLLSRDADSLTVIATLGSGRDHVVVLEPPGGEAFGLLVEEVSGVVTVSADEFGPSPAGQANDLVSGVFNTADGLVLVIEVAVLARALAS